jgi:hypothetical protein
MKIVSRITGQEKYLPMMSPGERSLWLMKKAIRGFDRLVMSGDLHTSFLTITQSNKSVEDGYRWITSVMAAMKKNFDRRGQLFYYVAVLEIQPKRYQKYGVLAPHWHIAIATSEPEALPHAVRQVDGHIKKVRNGKIITWDWLYRNVNQKFGMYFCCDCWSRQIYDYLAKYLAKGDLLGDFRRMVGRRVRVFSLSRLDVSYFMTWFQKQEFTRLVESEPIYGEMYMRRNGSRINLCSKETIENYEFDGHSSVKIYYRILHTIMGEWVSADHNRNDERDRANPLVAVIT